MTDERPAIPWLPSIGVFLACLTLAWSAASAWFDLRERVRLLEAQQQFSHGDVRPYME